MKVSTTKLVSSAVFMMVSGAALAHPGHEHTSSFVSGFFHPLGGLDHLLAMVAVGLWASSLGGRAVWAVPAAFVATMLLGGGLAIGGVSVPMIEQGILMSVVVLGALVLFARHLSLGLCATIAGGFALFHGAAHGIEMPLNTSGLAYVLGFALATMALHGLGLGFGQWMIKRASPLATRIGGAVIAVAGLVLAFA